ncbi:RNA polymerase factor sigma-54 [uncultured Flavonifractor sp.]|uniref:RNA polymerase factor sigma-54 n=1 Tax=Intestinimonas TaxID=1392389 RepID=UPI0006C49A65|nr:RNA polymerase factor sigma-54 [Intestinimonas massiliensis (ex Afouda et al. 2020)]MCQ4805801.1 RNA polymerase factor sigma-54 [Intestinimonas massiliensis (ex Afouda et al. 2020)]BDE88788.1 RNA polymerase sigma-54 factor [Oscillospiraceae bacterium]CUQ19823.1 RNA polymerase sigma-54 factor [Flavonifractor plautii]SCJ07109.1 RNA polymerase factor sigma-54 [uncultured Flavonifractor sp.]
MELSMSMKQTQTLSPQMMQSMEILQMGSQELLEYIQDQVQENPVLEMEEKYGKGDDTAVLQRKLEWLESTDAQNRYYHQQDTEDDEKDPISNYGTVDEREENLYLYVLSQLEVMDLEPELLPVGRFLVESLNQNGWLDESVEDLAEELGKPVEEVEKALAAVQSLEPAGVGARNLSECLVLQLQRRHEDSELAIRIARDYLDPLSKSRYGLIAKSLGVCQEEVRTACDLIRTLNPRPGGGFAARENLVYINPDLFVVNFPDHFELLTNDYFFPDLNISGYYCRMLKSTEDNEVKDYLMGKVRQAKWVVHSIEQRRSTLLRCAECILELQEEFFRRGPGHLKPMCLADIAQKVGVHESTVSRTVRDKYLQCASGVYPLSYFFSRSLGAPAARPGTEENTSSPDFAKALLKKLIGGEDKHKPLSDQKLCERMAREGCELSRRTVAKYRDELGIPSTTGRKQYE